MNCSSSRSGWIPAVLFVLCSGVAFSDSGVQPEPPCNQAYGSAEDRAAIQAAMSSGNAARVRHALDRAKATRGKQVGCPDRAYARLPLPGDRRRPNPAAVRAYWRERYVPALTDFSIGCPQTGRELAPLALAARRLASSDQTALALALDDVALMYQAQQYTAEHAPRPLVADAGIYGYFLADSAALSGCALQGIAAEVAVELCTEQPVLCPVYNGGAFAGLRFAVADHHKTPDGMIGDIGGAAFDTGWVGVMMIEAALATDDPELSALFRGSALRAGEWAMAQPLVSNHNYTAKTVWLLARLYGWTGRRDFRAALLDRLERNLLPAVLMDRDGDRRVDGLDDVAFEALSPVAQTPGRMWDGHNSLPWYQSINALAMVEAYVALRDRGDCVLAQRYRPYALAMVDNLANEILELGVPADIGVVWRDLPLSILMATWKIARHEHDGRPLWEQALWALWNVGAIQEGRGSRGVSIPYYIVLLDDLPYRPLAERFPEPGYRAVRGPRRAPTHPPLP